MLLPSHAPASSLQYQPHREAVNENKFAAAAYRLAQDKQSITEGNIPGALLHRTTANMSVSPLSLKDEGNALLHESPSGAIEKWALAISSQDCSEEIKIACYSNSALAHIQLRAWKDAIRCASAAISLSPTAHIKSLFRRAQAYRMLGSLGRSAADLRSILRVDKSNSAARVELDAVTGARLRPNVHADFMVRLLHCDKTDDLGNEDGLEAALYSCFDSSAKGLYQEAFQLFKGLPTDADNETELLFVSRRACEAWLLLNNMQFNEAEDVALRLVEDLAHSSSKTANSAVIRADSLMLLAWILSSAGHFDSALDRCDEAVQVSTVANFVLLHVLSFSSLFDSASSRTLWP
jgi:tetratricopeptide (TPR) repeat protein